MKKKPNLFHKFVEGDERHERLETAAALSYEARRVEYLLRRGGMMPQVGRKLRRIHEAEHGHQALRFTTFNAEYPSYPVLLGTANLTGLHIDPTCFLPNLFRKFADAPFVRAYDDFFELMASLAQGRAIGLVFPRKGIPQGLIIHNGVDLPQRVFRGLVLHYQSKKSAHQLFIQPYQSVVEQIFANGHGWKP